MSKKNLLCLITNDNTRKLVSSFFGKIDFIVEFLEKDLLSISDEKFLS